MGPLLAFILCPLHSSSFPLCLTHHYPRYVSFLLLQSSQRWGLMLCVSFFLWELRDSTSSSSELFLLKRPGPKAMNLIFSHLTRSSRQTLFRLGARPSTSCFLRQFSWKSKKKVKSVVLLLYRGISIMRVMATKKNGCRSSKSRKDSPGLNGWHLLQIFSLGSASSKVEHPEHVSLLFLSFIESILPMLFWIRNLLSQEQKKISKQIRGLAQARVTRIPSQSQESQSRRRSLPSPRRALLRLDFLII